MTAGWITALFLLDITDKRIETIISLSLRVLSTMVGVGVALAGLILKRRADRQEQHVAPKAAAADGGIARVITGETRDETESLDLYLRFLRHAVEELRRDQAPFVPLTTTAEPRMTAEELLPGLEWQRRPRPQQLQVTQPEKVDLETIPTRFRRTAFLGDPGSGKSTCLTELARQQLELVESSRVGSLADIPGQTVSLPLHVSLSEWNDPHQSAMVYLQRQLEARLGPGSFFSRDFENQLAGGRFLLLLDGLNEIPNRRASAGEGQHERPDEGIASIRPGRQSPRIDPRERSLRQLADDHPLCHFVVTCRGHEYFDSLDWQVVRVLPMDSDQIDRFIEAYLEPKVAAQLQKEIQGGRTPAAIAANPFFLSCLIGAYEPGADLSSRGEILHTLFTKLLLREQDRLGLEAPDARQVASYIGTIAFRMLRRGQVGENVGLPDANSPDQEYLDVLVGTGLLVERGGQLYFRHQLVQEYFAAAGLRLRVVHRRPQTLLADKRWSEVVGLWRDLDGRLDKRLVRCLAARNLPWRRPRSPGTAAQGVFETASTAAFMAAVGTVLLDFFLWPATTLSSPFGLLPVSLLALTAILVVLRLPWSWLVPHRKVIVNAAYVLGRSGYAVALRRMLKSMGRTYHSERAEIAEAIAQFGTDALPHIDRGLRSRRWRVRAGSVLALGALAARFPDDGVVVDRLILGARADDPRLARSFIEALGRCRQSRARQTLADLVARVSTTWAAPVRMQGLKTLSSTHRDESWDEEMVSRFDELAAPTRPPPVRNAILQAMGHLRLPGSEDKLAAIANNPNEPEHLRNTAASALGVIGTPAAAAHLLRLANLPPMTESALTAMNMLHDPETLPELLNGATHQYWAVRQAAVRALGRVGQVNAVPMLVRLVDDPDDDVRIEVARALGVAGHESALPPLLRLARDGNHEVRKAAFHSLTRSYPDLAASPLVELAQDQTYKDRLTAVRALAAYDSYDVEKALRRLGGDPHRQVSGLAQRLLDQVGSRRRQGAQPWWRHPVARSRAFVVTRLEWEGFSAMLLEEKQAGTPRGQRISSVVNRIGKDAELTRRYSRLLRLFMFGVAVAGAVGVLLVLLILRLSLFGATLVLHYWPIVVVLLLVAGATLLPSVARGEQVRVLGVIMSAIRAAAVSVLAVVALGALAYTWWIWLLILVAGALVMILRYVWVSVRRSSHAAASSSDPGTPETSTS